MYNWRILCNYIIYKLIIKIDINFLISRINREAFDRNQTLRTNESNRDISDCQQRLNGREQTSGG